VRIGSSMLALEPLKPVRLATSASMPTSGPPKVGVVPSDWIV
jgi:hypothetical protein